MENGHAKPQMSNRARKRAIRKDQAAQKEQEAHAKSPRITPESGGTGDSEKAARQLSVEAEMSEAKRTKRTKLDDNI